VHIPPHVRAGEVFDFEHAAKQYHINAPTPLPPDMLMRVTLPAAPVGNQGDAMRQAQAQAAAAAAASAAQQQQQQQAMLQMQMQYQQQMQAHQQQQHQVVAQQQQVAAQQQQAAQSEWTIAQDPASGRSYYFNMRSGEFRWA